MCDKVQPPQAMLSSTVSALFRKSTIAAEVRNLSSIAEIYPVELALVKGAILRRVIDFSGGRLCAREALSRLGIPDFPLLAGKDRMPHWPDSVVGSITHTTGYCAAVVAAYSNYLGIGIDAELIGRVDRELWTYIFTDREIDWLSDLTAEDQTTMATVLFSAKEAFFKCQYPITRKWLEFKDANLQITRNEFIVHIESHLLNREEELRGQFVLDGQLVITGIAYPYLVTA